VDQHTEKLTRKMKIIRSLQADLVSLDKEQEEKDAAIASATEELHKFSEADLEGDELFRVKFKHKKQLLQRTKRAMDVAKSKWEKLKKDRNQLIDDLIELDKGSLEDSLPLIVQSKLTKDPDNAWKDVPVSHLKQHGLAESIIEHFQTHGIDTLGKVEEFRKKHEVSTLDNITETMEKKFDAARDEFLEAYNSFLTGEEEGDEAEAEKKELTIDDLKLSEDVIDKLKAEGIASVKDMTEYLKKHGQDELKKMLGSRSFEKLKEAIK